MKPEIRATIAYVAGCISARRSYGAVSSQAEGTEIRMNGRFDHGNIDVEELAQGGRLIGMTSGQDASFFHSVANATISLKLNGRLFTGHDGVSGRNFNGAVQDGSVKVYDYDEGKYYDYCLT